MLEKKNPPRDQTNENRVSKQTETKKEIDDIESNNLSDSSSVTDVDILTKNSPSKDDRNEENERTDGSLGK